MARPADCQKLCLVGVSQCFLQADGACPSWDRLSLESDKDVHLSVQSMGSMLARLQEFTFSGRVRAALAFQVGAEMARMGRFCQMRARAPYGGDSCGDHDITNVSESGLESFDEIMSCGCQCCLVCLRRNGQLPRDFQVTARMPSPFGTMQEP